MGGLSNILGSLFDPSKANDPGADQSLYQRLADLGALGKAGLSGLTSLMYGPESAAGKGAAQLRQGAHEIATAPQIQASDPYAARAALNNQLAQGASDVVRGSMPFAAPMMAPAIAAAPLATLGGLGAGTLASKGTEALASRAGVSPGVASLAGDIAGGVAGTGAAEAGPLAGQMNQTLQSAGDAALARLQDRGTFSGAKLHAAVPVDDLGDMAIWGAAQIARGASTFNKWSKAMIADAGGQIEPELPGLYAKSQKIYDRQLQTTANQLPNTKKLLSMYQQGIEGQDWYAHTRDELEQHFGGDTDRMVDFLAATSSNNTVAGNVSQALKAYNQWKNGEPFTGFLPAHIDMLNQAVEDQPFGGPKITNFTQNLKGDPVAVTVDRWIARALGYGDNVNPQQYKFADYLITQAAQAKGIEPRQMQAAIWKTIKDTQGTRNDTGASFEDVLRAKLLKDPDLGPALQAASVSPPAPFRGAPVATVETATRLTPEGNEAADLFNQLPDEPWAQDARAQYQQIQRNMMRNLGTSPEKGQPSLISQLMSEVVGKPVDVSRIDFNGYGTYEGEINPNMRIPMTGRAGSGEWVTLSQPQREAFLALLGQDTDQAGMAASHFETAPKGAQPQTYSVFLGGAKANPSAIANFSKEIGFPVNVSQAPNGVLIDVNAFGGNPGPGAAPSRRRSQLRSRPERQTYRLFRRELRERLRRWFPISGENQCQCIPPTPTTKRRRACRRAASRPRS